MRRTLTALAALTVVATAALSGCTSDHGADRPAPPDLPTLTPAWTTRTSFAARRAWLVGTTLVTAGDRRVAGLDAGTGRLLWTVRLAGTPCTWSTGPNPAGSLAVLEAARSGPRGCRTVETIDLREGRVRWTRTLEHPSDFPPADFDGVSTGRGVVAVTDHVLGVAERLDARSGRTLSVVQHAVGAVSDGRHIYSLDYHLSAPDRADVRSAVVVVDQDTGRRIGTFPSGDSAVLHPLLAQPLLLGAEQGQGGDTLFSGMAGRRIGRGSPQQVSLVGHRLVAAYDQVLVVDDLRTGAEEAAVPLAGGGTFDDGGALVGAAGGAVIVATGNKELFPRTPVLERIDPAHPDAPLVLGAVDASPLAVTGDTVYAAGRTTVSAYRLPAGGHELADYVRALDWRPGELPFTATSDACRAVTPATLRRLGLAGKPVTGSCMWGARGLDVRVEAEEPYGQRSATSMATTALDSYDAKAVDIGDAGWLTTPEGFSGAHRATVNFRFRNVLVSVDAFVPRPQATVRAATLRAARDVLAELQRRAA